jgi:hypothetical protein
MVLSELVEHAMQAANAENSDRHSPSSVRRLINNAQNAIVKAGNLLVTDPLTVTEDLKAHVTQINGAQTASNVFYVDSVKYLKVGDRIDVLNIGGSSPGETLTRKFSDKRISALNQNSISVQIGTTISCADNDYLLFANDVGLIDAVEDEPVYRSPIRSLDILKVEYKRSATGTYIPLRQTDQKRIARSQRTDTGFAPGSVGTGWPTEWYMIGVHQFGLYPAPDAALAEALRLTYVRQPLELIEQDDEPEIPDYYHDVLWQYAAAQMLKRDANFDGAAALLQDVNGSMMMALMQTGGNPREPMTRGGS